MKRVFLSIAIVALITGSAFAEEQKITPGSLSLNEAISLALKNNPRIKAAERGVEAEGFKVDAAKGERFPVINLNGGATRYRYAQPITPITGSPLKGTAFPEFDNTIYDFSVSFTMPIYKGGRIERGITIAEIKRSAAEDQLKFNRQELIYNIKSVYYKIAQLEKLRASNETTVKSLEGHKRNVELAVNAGSVPKVDLLKTDVELSHARQNELTVRNNLESAYELLKTLIGVDTNESLAILSAEATEESIPAYNEGAAKALEQRADYKAAQKKKRAAEERVRSAEGRRLPQASLNGEYGDRSGSDLGFNENWFIGVRFTMPLFDGGVIKSDIVRERKEEEASKEEERALRNDIMREVKDAYLNIANSDEKVKTSISAIDAAKENLRIEHLKFDTGNGTTADVLDAESALIRSESEYYQAVFERASAIAALKRAIGEDVNLQESKR